jgi:hypothetical protein
VRMTRARRWARCKRVAAVVGCTLLVAAVALDGGAGHAGAANETPLLGNLVMSTIAPGYAVTSQGPLNASQFASDAPDPSATARALSTLDQSVSTYERVWRADGGLNAVQDVLVRFPEPVRAESFLSAALRSLQTGKIVSSDPMPSIPGARRVTYFAPTDQGGIGQAITTRAGVYVDLLSFLSAATGNAHPISPANAERLAEAQQAAMVGAPGGATTERSTDSKKGASAGTIGLAVIVVGIAAAAVAAPRLLRRRRLAQEVAAMSQPLQHAPPPASAGGDTVDDLGEHRG